MAIEYQSAIVADTVYSDGSLAARNATCTLPEISMVTAEIRAGGTIEAPVTGQVEAMEATITTGAPDSGFTALSQPGSHEVEVRWVQDSLGTDGTMRQVGCKAFMRAYAKTIPGISLEVGSASENEVTLGVTRFQLVVDGEEQILVDQLNGIFKVGGIDYAAGIAALL